jgi:hypothetical protein
MPRPSSFAIHQPYPVSCFPHQIGTNLRGEHLCDTAKVPRSVHREEQVNWSSPAKLAESCIETFVSKYGGRPDFVFERLLDILFLFISRSSESLTHGVRLDDKESRLPS